MDPLTIALLSAFAAAGAALAGGVADAADDDAWRAAKAKLARWAGLDQRARAAAFDKAVQAALADFRKTYSDSQAAEHALALLRDDRPDGRAFRQIAVEELVLSVRPNIGRLLDHYRRGLRFAAVLRGEEPPPWTEIELYLRLFLGALLPQTLAEQPALRPLLLEQAELAALDAARARTRAAEDSAATLRRIAGLLEELVALPRLAQGVTAGDGGTISQVRQIVVHGNYYAVPDLPPDDLEALYRRYQSFLVETFGLLDFRGIMQVQNVVRLRLEEVYVPLKARSSAGDVQVTLPGFADVLEAADQRFEILTETGRLRDSRARAARAPEHDDLHTFVRDTPFLVVLGDPGAGKSTLVRYVMLALAEGQARQRLGLDAEWLPILFPVAAFAAARDRRAELAPLDYLSEYYKGLSQPDYGSLFRRALLGGRALVLFDGLDEVREDRLALVKCLEAFVREWDAPGNRIVATSRIAGYDDAPLDDRIFVRATVQPFDDDDIRAFVARWSLAYERAGAQGLPTDPQVAADELRRRAEARARSLSAAVFANPNVTDLARNPLLLTILALIHNQGTRLPDRRVDLYRLCVEALAETWNRARSLSGREIDVYLGGEKLDERFVVNLLGPAALWIHEENPGGLVEQGDLERQLAYTLVRTDGLPSGKAQRLAQGFIDLVRRHTGLLQERGHRKYGFLHLTFEEYLAARALVDSAAVDDADALIHQRCADAGWREVLRLALASASQKETQRLLLHLLAAPTTAETHGRPVVLAGECLLDIGRNGATQRAWSAVIERLVALLGDPQAPLAIRVEGGHLLGRLGDPRLLDPRIGDAPIGGYWCAVAAGPFWYGDDTENLPLQQVELPYSFKIARYPVTNAEYARFVDDDGYNPAQPWWTEQGRAFLQPGGHPYDNQEQPITLPRDWNDPQYNSPAQPVVGVSWYEAAAYCAWLTAQGHKQGWLPATDAIRLPTSLEWERAARHTDKPRYPWGDAEPDVERANYDETRIGAPSPVGCFPAGAAGGGALDMAGNVMEWMATPSEARQALDPQKDFTPDERVLLSASAFWREKEHLCCGARYWVIPFDGYGGRGFRIVWSLGAQE
ncbi:MAG TPA: SUMF1/EgtB/PvdO family nonheme iron enzyme [Roseiflexaceae bacterium]